MTDKYTPEEKQTQSSGAVRDKKVYKRPSFRYERVFETAALACGKIAGTNPVCNSSRKTS